MAGNDVKRKQLWNKRILIPALLLALLLCACGETAQPAVTSTPAPAVPAATETPAPTPAPTPEPTSVPASSSDLNPPPASSSDLVPATTEPTEPPEEFARLREQPPVGDELFSDAAFFGNSLVCGLQLYGGLTQGDFYAVTSASVVNVSLTKNFELPDGSHCTLLQALADKSYGKVYVLLGINEIGFETAHFIELYSDVLDQIAEIQPEAELYIMSLTPVTQKKSEEGALFSMERVREYNEALEALAQQRGCRFLDLVEALADDSGYLAAADSSDGIHLMPVKYHVWADCLRSHYDPADPALQN